MKAAYIERTGPPEVIRYGELPEPKPAGHEVLVRVAAVALNPVDTYIRSGMIAAELPKPYIIGCDLAGTVEAVGPEVQRFKPGDRVWGSNQGIMGRQGTFAEYACVHEQWLYPIPAGVEEQQAAAVALVSITAHLGLFRTAGLRSGETVFVNGGTGGVGSMVVQMAKAVDAKVIATVGSEQKAELCRSWGADRVVQYKTEDVDEAIRDFTHGRGVDLWFETLREPNFERSFPLIRTGGRMVVMAGRDAKPPFPVGTFYVKDLTLYGFVLFNAPADQQRQCAEQINRWLQEGKLRAPIGRVFKLAEAAEAHRLQEENTLGKAGTLTGKIVLLP